MVNESNNNFDDLDLTDDLDDPWDDADVFSDGDNDGDIDELFEEEGITAPTQKKKSIVKPLAIVFIIGGGLSIASLLLLKSGTPQSQAPIIKLSETTVTEAIQPIEPIQSINNEIEAVTNNIKNDNEIKPEIIYPSLNDNQSILTPMPNNLSDNGDINLPDLIEQMAQNKTDIQSPDIDQVTETRPTLSEDDLLTQTEITFKDKPQPEITTLPEKEELVLSAKAITNDIPAIEFIPSKSENTEIAPKEIIKTTKPVEARAKNSPPPKTTQIKIKKAPSWVIRAAQSGSAVIYNKTTKEMQSIEVNDRVKGIGRIKSIKMINGRWIISGTSGKIKQ